MTDILDRLFDRTYDLEETLHDAHGEIEQLRADALLGWNPPLHWQGEPLMDDNEQIQKTFPLHTIHPNLVMHVRSFPPYKEVLLTTFYDVPDSDLSGTSKVVLRSVIRHFNSENNVWAGHSVGTNYLTLNDHYQLDIIGLYCETLPITEDRLIEFVLTILSEVRDIVVPSLSLPSVWFGNSITADTW